MGTRFDPASPYENAQPVNEFLPHSALLTVEGWGHTSFDVPSQCTEEVVSRYLVEATTPAEGTTCAADFGPFDTP